MLSLISRIKNKLTAMYRYLKYDGKITELTLSQISYDQILTGKKILITGGSDGIGFHMAMKFVSLGAKVLITGRSVDKLQTAARKIANPNLYILSWDVTNFDTMQSLFDEAVSVLEGLDILVNNAGYVAHRSNDMAYFDKMIETNFKACYFLNKIAVNYFLQNVSSTSKIINISSSNSFKNDTNAYTLSKKCVNELTKGFAKEYGDRNIIINAISPGYVNASINKVDIDENANDSRCRIHRIVTPEDIAELAVFLCSDASNAIVGQIIGVDGGVYINN